MLRCDFTIRSNQDLALVEIAENNVNAANSNKCTHSRLGGWAKRSLCEIINVHRIYGMYSIQTTSQTHATCPNTHTDTHFQAAASLGDTIRTHHCDNVESSTV